jgi:hypothetical protein
VCFEKGLKGFCGADSGVIIAHGKFKALSCAFVFECVCNAL